MKYYHLKEGEIIKEGDEVESSSSYSSPAKWVKVQNTIGRKAPNPNFISHRKYRRKVCEHHPFDRDTDDFGNVVCGTCGDIVDTYGSEEQNPI